MDHTKLKGGIFDLQKDPVVLGTYESSAFILSLRDPEEFHSIHSFGYHCIPHIGVYGNDYSLSLPMVLLSLPPTPSYLQELPSDLLNALDLQEIVAQKSVGVVSNPSKTKLEMFSEHIRTVLQDHGNLSPEYCSRVVAKELVKLVISSACTTLGLNGSNYIGMENSSMDSYSDFRDLKEESDIDTGMAGFENMSGYMRWREAKRGSTVSAMSIESETFASREITTLPEEAEPNGSPGTRRRRNGHKRVTVTKRPGIIVHKPEDEDDEIRIAAKKLVKKVLHYACKKWESLYRRSSVEYLIANTKRMKITESPSPPPTLLEEPSMPPRFLANYSSIQPQVFQHNSSVPAPPKTSIGSCENPSSTGLLSPPLEEREGSPTHAWRKLGKKRGRSESHELMMLKELDTFRQSKLGQKLQQMTDKFSAILKPRITLVKVQSASESIVPQDYISRDLLSSGERMSVKTLTSNIGRMSIAEESGTDCDTDGDEEYTVLSPITKRPPELDAEVYDSECDVVENTGGFQSLPATINDNWSGSIKENDHRFTMSYPDLSHWQRPSAHAFMEDTGLYPQCSTSKELSDCHTTGQSPNYQSVPEMDLFIIVHTHPVPSICQKFLCNNTNEINLMYHCWMFPDLPYDRPVTRSDWLEMGVFKPLGVQPAHLDLQDAGVTFYFLDPRTVCVHDCRFSPENAQLQLMRGVRFHTFFSAAKHGTRRVVGYHVIPATPSVELSVRECIQYCSNLGELITKLSHSFPEVGQDILHLISPLRI